MALPTSGRVIIDTTVGELDLELWSKETPIACRSFLALAMEGYYDGVIFHRVIPGFLVQTGDKTGTGNGGESFYGEPFEDEFHPRLRFSHRGLVGMANNGKKNSNDSQFFITLDRADELHEKHTLFGRCVGDTVYNAMKIGELELNKEGRPLYPPKIRSIRILDNPFPDIVPRITAAERREQRRAKEQAQREREENEKKKGAKKNVKLLSFGTDEQGEDEGEMIKKKPIFRPELVNEAQLPDFVVQPGSSTSTKHLSAEGKGLQVTRNIEEKEGDIMKIREQHAKQQEAKENSRKLEIEKMEAEVRKLRQRGDLNDDENSKKKAKTSYLSDELAKYSKMKGIYAKGKKRDEGDTLAMLNNFRGKLQSSMSVDDDIDDEDGNAEEGMEVDNDFGFLTHELHFPKDNTEETDKAERDYEVIDPRQRGAKAREEEKQRKKASAKGKDHGRSR